MEIKGFTLIEMLIYVTLLAVVGVLVVNAMVFFAPSYSSLKVSRDINSAGIATIERVTREVRSARSVDTVKSIFNVSEGKLVVNNASGSVELYLSNGRVYVEDGTGPSAITRKNVTVTSLLFKHIISPESETIQMDMTVEGVGRSSTKTETFHAAVVLRNLYSLGVAYFEGSYYSQGYFIIRGMMKRGGGIFGGTVLDKLS